jgi:hypothetical protein
MVDNMGMAIIRTAVAAAAFGLMSATSFSAQLPLDKTQRETGAVWSTPGDGRLVMLMRNTDGFTAPIAARVRVCVTNLTGSSNSVNLYIWTTGNPWDATPVMPLQQTRHLDLGECVEIDQPAALIIQDSTTSGIASGYYELLDLPPNVPLSEAVDNRDTHKLKDRGNSVYIGSTQKPLVTCGGPAPALSNYFRQSCALTLDSQSADPEPPDPNLKVHGVRICTGDKFVVTSLNPPNIDYPPGYLELIINKSLLTIDPPQVYDYNWNPVTPNGCRDVIAGSSDINSLVGNIYFASSRNRVGNF